MVSGSTGSTPEQLSDVREFFSIFFHCKYICGRIRRLLPVLILQNWYALHITED